MILFLLAVSLSRCIQLSAQGMSENQLRTGYKFALLVCNGPLGMINGEIRDWQITASSSLVDPDCHEKYARLYQPLDRAWCARQKSDSEWLQIDLGIAAKVSDSTVVPRSLERKNCALLDLRCFNSRSNESRRVCPLVHDLLQHWCLPMAVSGGSIWQSEGADRTVKVSFTSVDDFSRLDILWESRFLFHSS